MNDTNPYAPPRAPVSDIDNSPKPPLPRHVETACQLMWINLWLASLDGLIKVFRAQGVALLVAGIIGGLLGLGIAYVLTRWITRKLLAGRNWMRWLLTGFYIVSWLAVPVFWDFYAKFFKVILANPSSAIILVLETVIGIATLVLLHTKPSRQWFGGSAAAV